MIDKGKAPFNSSVKLSKNVLSDYGFLLNNNIGQNLLIMFKPRPSLENGFSLFKVGSV